MKLKSKNAICRVHGCLNHVPSYGWYRGLPQAHCYRCGMKTNMASSGCPDYSEHVRPPRDWIESVYCWFLNTVGF